MSSGDNHVLPLEIFYKVFAALIGLTVLTVVTAKYMDFGSASVLVAFSIATVKGLLVMAYFMHLKYEEAIFRWIIGLSFIFVALLFIICTLDIMTRIPQFNDL